MNHFIETCHALKDALYYEAGRPSLNLQMTMPERWSSPGLDSDLKIGECPLRSVIEDVHDFNGIDLDAVVVLIEALAKSFSPKLACTRLQAVAPGIKWEPLKTTTEHKVRIFQAMELGRRAGGQLWFSANRQVTRLSVGGWSVGVEAGTVTLGGGRRLRRKPLQGSTHVSWATALNTSPGFSKMAGPYLSSFRLAVGKVLPAYKAHVDLLCRVAATSDAGLTQHLMETFDAPKAFRYGGDGGKRGQAGLWLRMSEVVDSATINPIRQMVRYMSKDFPAAEVYRLFGQPRSAAGGPFPPAVRQHFLDVIADLEAGYIRTRDAVKTGAGTETEEDRAANELAELIAIQESLR